MSRTSHIPRILVIKDNKACTRLPPITIVGILTLLRFLPRFHIPIITSSLVFIGVLVNVLIIKDIKSMGQ